LVGCELLVDEEANMNTERPPRLEHTGAQLLGMQVRKQWAVVVGVAVLAASSATHAAAAPSIASLRTVLKAAVVKTASVSSAVSWTVSTTNADGLTVVSRTRTDTRGGVERSGDHGGRYVTYLVDGIGYLSTASLPQPVTALVSDIESYQWLTRQERASDRFAAEVLDSFDRTGAASVIAGASSATTKVSGGVRTLRFKRARTAEQVNVTIRAGILSKVTVSRAGDVSATITLEPVADERVLRPVGMTAPYPVQGAPATVEQPRVDEEQEPAELTNLNVAEVTLTSAATAVLNATEAAAQRRQGSITLGDLLSALEAITDDAVGTEIARSHEFEAAVEFHNTNDLHVAFCVVVPLQGVGIPALNVGRCPR
jgi:hypothetical protein